MQGNVLISEFVFNLKWEFDSENVAIFKCSNFSKINYKLDNISHSVLQAYLGGLKFLVLLNRGAYTPSRGIDQNVVTTCDVAKCKRRDMCQMCSV